MPGKVRNPPVARDPITKMVAIQRVLDGKTKAAVGRELDVPESTLRGWCKAEDKIREMVRNKRKKPDTPSDMNEADAKQRSQPAPKLDYVDGLRVRPVPSGVRQDSNSLLQQTSLPQSIQSAADNLPWGYSADASHVPPISLIAAMTSAMIAIRTPPTCTDYYNRALLPQQNPGFYGTFHEYNRRADEAEFWRWYMTMTSQQQQPQQATAYDNNENGLNGNGLGAADNESAIDLSITRRP